MKFDTLGSFIDTSAIDARIDAVIADIAPEFAAANAYVIGDVVTYNDQLYQFKAAHTAGNAWDATEVDAIDVLDLIDAAEPDSLTSAQMTALIAIIDGTSSGT